MLNGPVYNAAFDIVPAMGFVIIIIVVAILISTLVKNAREFAINNSMPQLAEPARIIAKRTHTWGGQGQSSAHTSYYITFEMENGERLELPVSGHVFGLNIEGDTGILTHQGTRFINFERERF